MRHPFERAAVPTEAPSCSTGEVEVSFGVIAKIGNTQAPFQRALHHSTSTGQWPREESRSWERSRTCNTVQSIDCWRHDDFLAEAKAVIHQLGEGYLPLGNISHV